MRKSLVRSSVPVGGGRSPPSLVTVGVMHPWLIVYLLRRASGERFRTATPKEMRWWSGYFVLLPAFGAVFSFVDSVLGPVVRYWPMVAYAAAFVISIWIAVKLWARYVPAKVSWIIGAVEWAILFYLGLTGRLLSN